MMNKGENLVLDTGVFEVGDYQGFPVLVTVCPLSLRDWAFQRMAYVEFNPLWVEPKKSLKDN